MIENVSSWWVCGKGHVLSTVEPLYKQGPWDHGNSLLYRVKNENIKSCGQQNHLFISDILNIGALYNEVPLYSACVQWPSCSIFKRSVAQNTNTTCDYHKSGVWVPMKRDCDQKLRLVNLHKMPRPP